MVLASHMEAIKPSGIRRMFNKALEYEDVISFTLGEPDFTASDNVVEAGCRAIRNGKTKYTANAGTVTLRQAISKQLSEYGLAYEPDREIVVTVGAMEALYLSLKTLVNPGDEVIIPTPCWTNYFQQVEMCGGRPIAVPCKRENAFRVDINDLKNAITAKSRVLMLNSPCNPTGAVLDEATLKGIAELAMRHDLVVLTDEVYRKILFEGRHMSIALLSGMKERSVVIDSFSKGYAMTGWRIGYAAGPKIVVEAITRLQENVAACATTPAQYAAEEALMGPQSHTENMVEQYKQRRNYLVERINDIQGISCDMPSGTFYSFIDIRELGVSSETFADKLLEKRQVVVVPGCAFGDAGRGFIRISFATSMELIKEGIDRIKLFIEKREYLT